MSKVWVNGSFDVLHLGHVKLLQYASSLGTLKIGIDSDSRIKLRKGVERPFNTLVERIEFLQSLKFVHDVVSFETDEQLLDLIRGYKPDILVIGEEYKNNYIVGKSLFSEIKYFNRIPNKSTTLILNYGKTNNM